MLPCVPGASLGVQFGLRWRRSRRRRAPERTHADEHHPAQRPNDRAQRQPSGDTLAVASLVESDGSTTRYAILFYDDTNVRVIFAQNGGFQIMHKTAGTLHALTLASWRYRMYAEAH